MSPRPRTADCCFDAHELEVGGQLVTFLCRRRRGHPGYHQCRAISWGTLWDRVGKIPGPPRRSEEPRPRAC
jgi:hypothetical protein